MSVQVLEEGVSIVHEDVIHECIYVIRGVKVMFASNLAKLYGVETGQLNQAVKRNLVRFPEDFMFQLNEAEFGNWKSQIGISNSSVKMGLRKKPYVFTENGVAMLSDVLRSSRAIKVNISIMRTFNRMRSLIASDEKLAQKFTELERSVDERFDQHVRQIKALFVAIKKMMTPVDKPKRPIDFSPWEEWYVL